MSSCAPGTGYIHKYRFSINEFSASFTWQLHLMYCAILDVSRRVLIAIANLRAHTELVNMQ